MANQINLQPQVLDLMLYSGDGFKVKLTCMDKAGAPVDVTGAVTAQIRLDRLTPENPPVLAMSVDLTDAYLGVVKLSLTGDQTQELTDGSSAKNGKFVGVWDVEWDSAADEPKTLCQGVVECVADVTR
jgi:hypothetical protein